jgi:hypothetical protein
MDRSEAFVGKSLVVTGTKLTLLASRESAAAMTRQKSDIETSPTFAHRIIKAKPRQIGVDTTIQNAP